MKAERAAMSSGRIVGVDGDYLIVMVHKRQIEKRREWRRNCEQRRRDRLKAAKLAAAAAEQA